MGLGITDSQNYTNIAAAIREKTGGSDTYTPTAMANAIRAIPGGSSTVTKFVNRPNAELIWTYEYDHWVVDEEIATLPAYTTSAKTVIASQNLTPVIALDLASYDYIVLLRALTIPSYADATRAKGYQEYSITAGCYEITTIPSGEWIKLDGSAGYGSRNTTIYAAGLLYKELYYTSATALNVYAASTYGIHQVSTAPSVSSATSGTPNLTIKTPTLYMRGSTTYLTSDAWGALTDVRRQFKLEVYRSAKNDLSYDGWVITQEAKNILQNLEDPTHKLT